MFMKGYDAILCLFTARLALPNHLSMWDEKVITGINYYRRISLRLATGT